MSECNYRPAKNAPLAGENVGPLPNKGTGTGAGDSYGASLGQDATNGKGGFDAGSDPAMQDMPSKGNKV
jgi:hypothetical protein